MPFALRKALKSSDVKLGALSDTICSGIPYRAKVVLRASIVLALDDPGVGSISTHLEWASIMTKNMDPATGPGLDIYAGHWPNASRFWYWPVDFKSHWPVWPVDFSESKNVIFMNNNAVMVTGYSSGAVTSN